MVFLVVLWGFFVSFWVDLSLGFFSVVSLASNFCGKAKKLSIQADVGLLHSLVIVGGFYIEETTNVTRMASLFVLLQA